MSTATQPTSTEDESQPWIVVGVDGSEQSEQALRWAQQLAPAPESGWRR